MRNCWTRRWSSAKLYRSIIDPSYLFTHSPFPSFLFEFDLVQLTNDCIRIDSLRTGHFKINHEMLWKFVRVWISKVVFIEQLFADSRSSKMCLIPCQFWSYWFFLFSLSFCHNFFNFNSINFIHFLFSALCETKIFLDFLQSFTQVVQSLPLTFLSKINDIFI